MVNSRHLFLSRLFLTVSLAVSLVACGGSGGGNPLPIAPPPVDTTPDAFTLTALPDAPVDTAVISDPVTVTGINTDTPISVVGGEYSINNGAFTTADGMVSEGDSVRVQLTTSPNRITSVEATLTIGGVSGTFTVTTFAIPVEIQSFVKTTDMTLRWETSGALECELVNDQNTATLSIIPADIDAGNAVHLLPPESVFTLMCTGEDGSTISASAETLSDNLFPETVGYYGSAQSVEFSWVAIVNLTSPIDYTDQLDFRAQVDSYCANLGYVGQVTALAEEEIMEDSIYFSNSFQIVSDNRPLRKTTLIPNNEVFTNVYTQNRINPNPGAAFVGVATIGNSASSIRSEVASPTAGDNPMVLCQTDIRLRNTIALEQAFAFEDEGPVELAFGVDPDITNPAAGGDGLGAITYVSSDPSVATVNADTGLVSQLALGTTQITASKAAESIFSAAEATYELIIRAPLPVDLRMFERTDNRLIWETRSAVSCEITNDQNMNVISILVDDLDSGVTVHDLPLQTAFTLTCVGETGVSDAITATAAAVDAFPETVGYYGSAVAGNSWAAIVNLNETISYTDQVDFNGQVDDYCANLGYVGVVRTQTGDFATDDTFYVNSRNAIIAPFSGNFANPRTVIPGDAEVTNIYTLANNLTNARVGTARIGNDSARHNVGAATNPTSGTDPKVLCQTDIRLGNLPLAEQSIEFQNTEPAEFVLGVTRRLQRTTTNGAGGGVITYASSNTAVATVDESSGSVTGVAPGSATITATKAVGPLYQEAQASYVVNVREPVALELRFEKTTATTLAWETTGAVSCDISNDQNTDTIAVRFLDLPRGSAMHALPPTAQFTITCAGELAPGSLVATDPGVSRFPETEGYFGERFDNRSVLAAIVNLTSPISFTDRIDFNDQVSSYCESLGYPGAVKTLRGDFATDSRYYFALGSTVISVNGASGDFGIISGGGVLTNIYANLRNLDSRQGDVGIATIGAGGGMSTAQSVDSPTTGPDQRVLCHTDIRLIYIFPGVLP